MTVIDALELRARPQTTNPLLQDLVKQPAKALPTSTSGTPPANESLPKTAREETLQKARIVFGSRLAGPVERRRELDSASTRIAGILVPPRPDEPDNCCMSGCVNCVWDRYRDEIEEWAARSAEAREALQRQRAREQGARERTRGRESGGNAQASMPSSVASSMDDDGGGSESLWTGNEDGSLLGAGGSRGGDLFAGVPVGIREFMRTEKRLKEKKLKQAQS